MTAFYLRILLKFIDLVCKWFEIKIELMTA